MSLKNIYNTLWYVPKIFSFNLYRARGPWSILLGNLFDFRFQVYLQLWMRQRKEKWAKGSKLRASQQVEYCLCLSLWHTCVYFSLFISVSYTGYGLAAIVLICFLFHICYSVYNNHCFFVGNWILFPIFIPKYVIVHLTSVSPEL